MAQALGGLSPSCNGIASLCARFLWFRARGRDAKEPRGRKDWMNVGLLAHSCEYYRVHLWLLRGPEMVAVEREVSPGFDKSASAGLAAPRYNGVPIPLSAGFARCVVDLIKGPRWPDCLTSSETGK